MVFYSLVAKSEARDKIYSQDSKKTTPEYTALPHRELSYCVRPPRYTSRQKSENNNWLSNLFSAIYFKHEQLRHVRVSAGRTKLKIANLSTLSLLVHRFLSFGALMRVTDNIIHYIKLWKSILIGTVLSDVLRIPYFYYCSIIT